MTSFLSDRETRSSCLQSARKLLYFLSVLLFGFRIAFGLDLVKWLILTLALRLVSSCFMLLISRVLETKSQPYKRVLEGNGEAQTFKCVLFSFLFSKKTEKCDFKMATQRVLPQSKETLLQNYNKRLKDDIRSILDNFTEIIKTAKVGPCET